MNDSSHEWNPTQLHGPDLLLCEAWKEAAQELGVEVIAPFHLFGGGQTFVWSACVPDFGVPGMRNGIIYRALSSRHHPDQHGAIWDTAIDAGYFPVYTAAYVYIRENFVNHLQQFLWHGEAKWRPEWHKPDEPLLRALWSKLSEREH